MLITLFFLVLDGVAALCGLAVVGRPGSWRLLPFVLVFGPFQAYLVRSIRLTAYVQEWVFDRSYRDPYVPAHVLEKAPRY